MTNTWSSTAMKNSLLSNNALWGSSWLQSFIRNQAKSVLFFPLLKNFFICFRDGWFLLAAVILRSPLAPRRFYKTFTRFYGISRYWSVIKYTCCAWWLVIPFNIKSDMSHQTYLSQVVTIELITYHQILQLLLVLVGVQFPF